MVFEILYPAAQQNELILIDGGMCHFHLRRDGQLTIRTIISTKLGSGSTMLSMLEAVEGAIFLYAKCPTDLPSNAWYQKKGFSLDKVETTPSGRQLNCWKKPLCKE